MSRPLRLAALVTALIAVSAIALYANLGRIAAWVTERQLASNGIDATVSIETPGLSGVRIHRLALSSDEWNIVASDIQVAYDLTSLRQFRVNAVRVVSIDVWVPPTGRASSTTEFRSPWELIPSSSVEIASLSIHLAQPRVEMNGHGKFDPRHMDASIHIQSPALPAALDASLNLDRSGVLALTLARSRGSPLLELSAEADAGDELVVRGAINLDSATLALLAEFVGLPFTGGHVDGTLAARMPRAILDTGDWTQASINARLNAALGADLPPLYGIQSNGPLEIDVSRGSLTVGLAHQRITAREFDLGGKRVRLSESSRIELSATEASLSLYPEIDAPLETLRVEGDAAISLTVPQSIELADDVAVRGGRIAGNAHFRLGAGVAGVVMQELSASAAEITHGGARYTMASGSAATVGLDLSLPIAALSRADFAFARLRQRGNLHVTLSSDDSSALASKLSVSGGWEAIGSDEEIEVTIDKGLSIDALVRDHEFIIETTAPFGVRRITALSELRVDRTNYMIRVPEVHVIEQRLSFQEAQLQLNPFTFAKGELQISGTARTTSSALAIPVKFAITANTAARSGKFEVNAGGKAGRRWFKSELPGWQAEYDLDGGDLTLHFTGTFAAPESGLEVDGAGRLELKDGTVHFGQTVLAGIDTIALFSVADHTLTYRADKVQIATVDAGLSFTDVTLDLSGNERVATVSAMTAHTLAGQIAISSLDYDIGRQFSEFTVGLTGIDLAQVLALEGTDVVGNGTLDGTLPVTLSPAGPSIKAGHVSARPPGGHISFKGDVGHTVPGLDLAIDALRNFNYTSMIADVDYQRSGALTLMIHLMGRNPDVEKGRPFAFNLNVNEDIPALLESLRASRSAEERVQQRLSR